MTKEGSGDYQILARYPHNPGLFTQGLELYKGRLYESSGLYGRSRVISQTFPPQADADINGVALPETLFAEGLTLYRNRLYLLTWQAQTGLVLDPHHFGLLAKFRYSGEGWGLCYHAKLGPQGHFLMSNGSAALQWLRPSDMQVVKSVAVTENGQAVTKLNELECVGPWVVANIWYQDDIVFIDPHSGKVVLRIDLSALAPVPRNEQAVLNGIAYDASDDSWLVTGKFWPQLYRLRITAPDHTHNLSPEP